MAYKDPEKKKEHSKSYENSPLGKETRQKYEQLPKVKEYRRKYRNSPEGKERRQKYEQLPKVKEKRKKYHNSPSGKEKQRKYYTSPKGKSVKRKYNNSLEGKESQQRYTKSPKGIEAYKKADYIYNNSPKGKASQKRYRDSPKGQETSKRIILRNKYSINLEKYNELTIKQHGKCAICSEPSVPKKLGVDHDHNCCPGEKSCGKCIRGLLCNRCNLLLGLCKDSILILQKAVCYLKKTKNE